MKLALPRVYPLGVPLALFWVASSLPLSAQENPPPTPPAEVKPANFARLLGGATVLYLNESTGGMNRVAGMSAVIDDDAVSGWTPPVGRTVMLIELPADMDLSSFTFFAPGAKGEYTLSSVSSPEAAADPAARQKILSSTLGQEAPQTVSKIPVRYVILEVDVVESAPIRSIDVVGQQRSQAAAEYTVVVPDSSKEQNAGKADAKSIEVNFAADALGAKAADEANDKLGALIDGDTGTTTTLTTKDGAASAEIKLAAAVSVNRLSLAFEKAKGVVRFFVADSDNNRRMVGEFELDGENKTFSIDTSGVSTESITMVWVPTDGSSPLVVSELGVFALARLERKPPAPDYDASKTNVRIDSVTPEPTAPPPPAPPPPPPPVVVPTPETDPTSS